MSIKGHVSAILATKQENVMIVYGWMSSNYYAIICMVLSL